MTWVTVGSGLNLAWRMRAERGAGDGDFWAERPRLDGYVNWIDLYSGYDPVPVGPPPAVLVRTLVGGGSSALRAAILKERGPLGTAG